jgi:hypothetical protein
VEQWIKEGKYWADLGTALLPPAYSQDGTASTIRPSLQPGELSTLAGLAQSNQRPVITQPSGEVDQDGELE